MSKSTIGKFGLKLDQVEEIESALEKINGRASIWVIDTHKEVLEAANNAEQQFDAVLLPKTYRVGATATTYGYAPGRGYSYGVASTEIQFRRFADGWRVMNVSRVKLYPADSRALKVKIAITPQQAEKIREVTTNRFAYQPEKQVA
ncbi:hypothetical protein A8A54_04455 [Brucella pseudogrignonensis]|uniref:hypothetical protein n=1 Tax=Brucella pseudogrignonensis TaxID=419475 RepID=UPI0007DA8D3A|nr:hypothetical protein [Brucella pseudogrignonensis]ANG95803.1 hypothetical protein A8A54_04455 [Brucella pseudogrignonensis]